jgi:acyl-CoA hydrolase
VTAAVDRMAFIHPVHVGELLQVTGMVNAAWRSSMEVGVRVVSENPLTGETRHTNSAYLTMVAVDEGGRPVEVPELVTSSPEEERRAQEAQLRRRNRLAEREQILASRTAEDD